MRTNSCNVTEVAHIRTDLDKFSSGHERIFGKPVSPFCDKCEKRHSLCECQEEVCPECQNNPYYITQNDNWDECNCRTCGGYASKEGV